MRKYKLPDYLAHYFGTFLPKRTPNFHKMKDDDFITVLSWCEDWEPERVYKTAYRQSHLDYFQTWQEWSADMQPLPIAVKAELQRALKIHIESGNMQALRAYAFFYEGVEKFAKYAFWVFILTTILLWIS